MTREAKEFEILKWSPFEGQFDLCLVQSNLLPDGYNGQMELSLDGGDLKFRKWADT